MIINPIIFGSGGGGGDGVDINYQSFFPTSAMTISEFFQNYDIRFKYKNSILFVYIANYNATGLSSANRVKLLWLPNGTNYTDELFGRYNNRTNWSNYNWNNIIAYGSSNTLAHNAFLVDASTGRISSTNTTLLCDNGTCVSVWEMPIDPRDTSTTDIDTTSWGTT